MVRWKHTLIAAATLATLATPFAQATTLSLDESSTSDAEETFDVPAWVAKVDAELEAAGLQPVLMGDAPSDCPDQRDEEAVALADRYYVKHAKQYDGTITLTLYGETNALPGLQTWWTLCDPEGTPIPPDNSITGASTDRRLFW